jgi:hypothetical protein
MKGSSRLTIGCIFALNVLVTGCAGEQAEQLFVQPGRFDYLDCPELARVSQRTAKREQELQTLIERAEREPVGAIFAAPSYGGDLLKAQGEQRMLAEVMTRKKCAPDSPPAPTSARPSRRR